jgi:hypothetical protein
MDSLAETIRVECHGIGVVVNRLVELQDGEPVVTIPIENIMLVTLDHGVASERTSLLLVVGGSMLAFSLWILFGAVRLLLEGGVPYEFELAFVLLAPIGVALLHLALRKRFFLLVQTRDETRKVAFDADATQREAQQFLDSLRPSLHCPVRSKLASHPDA